MKRSNGPTPSSTYHETVQQPQTWLDLAGFKTQGLDKSSTYLGAGHALQKSSLLVGAQALHPPFQLGALSFYPGHLRFLFLIHPLAVRPMVWCRKTTIPVFVFLTFCFSRQFSPSKKGATPVPDMKADLVESASLLSTASCPT